MGSRLGQIGSVEIIGQNYIINDNKTIPASSSLPFIYDLVGIAGRVRLTYAAGSNNLVTKNSVRDLEITSFEVERFDSTRPEDLLIDGTVPLNQIFPENIPDAVSPAALPGYLASVEYLQARSRIKITVQNNALTPVFVSLTFFGYTIYGDEYLRDDVRSVTERGGIPQASF